jgi:hypothetical protein
MTSLLQQIEDMRIRMNELATNEQDLVRVLGDALIVLTKSCCSTSVASNMRPDAAPS